MTDRKGSAYKIVQHDQFGGRSVMVWGHTDIYRLGNSRHQDEVLGLIVKLYTGALGPGFLLVTMQAIAG